MVHDVSYHRNIQTCVHNYKNSHKFLKTDSGLCNQFYVSKLVEVFLFTYWNILLLKISKYKRHNVKVKGQMNTEVATEPVLLPWCYHWMQENGERGGGPDGFENLTFAFEILNDWFPHFIFRITFVLSVHLFLYIILVLTCIGLTYLHRSKYSVYISNISHVFTIPLGFIFSRFCHRWIPEQRPVFQFNSDVAND